MEACCVPNDTRVGNRTQVNRLTGEHSTTELSRPSLLIAYGVVVWTLD